VPFGVSKIDTKCRYGLDGFERAFSRVAEYPAPLAGKRYGGAAHQSLSRFAYPVLFKVRYTSGREIEGEKAAK